MMLRSLRLSSQLADKVEGAVAATNLVVIVHDSKYKETIHSAIQNWLQAKPEYDSKQPDHPCCEKKLFVFATVSEVLSGEFKESEAVQVLSDLQKFQTEELARWVAAGRPRFAHPKENRPYLKCLGDWANYTASRPDFSAQSVLTKVRVNLLDIFKTRFMVVSVLASSFKNLKLVMHLLHVGKSEQLCITLLSTKSSRCSTQMHMCKGDTVSVISLFFHVHKAVNEYCVLAFANSNVACLHSFTVDNSGSSTRATKLSETSNAKLQEDVDEHNKHAAVRGRHFITDIYKPDCAFCQQSVARSYLRTWMKRDCKSAPAGTPARKGLPMHVVSCSFGLAATFGSVTTAS